jgi:hypothetical protein
MSHVKGERLRNESGDISQLLLHVDGRVALARLRRLSHSTVVKWKDRRKGLSCESIPQFVRTGVAAFDVDSRTLTRSSVYLSE